jgi:F-type H+-transporting ATPase subunit b
MLNFGPTFIWVIINLIILYLILRRVLFKPVTKFMEDRTNSIKADLENADRAKSEAALLLQEYKDKLSSARKEADSIVSDAHERAQNEYETILAAARKDSELLLKKAGEQVEQERQQMLKEMKNQVASLALAAASKVLEANMDNETNRKLVDKFIDEEGAA